jgi:hypothetical protein
MTKARRQRQRETGHLTHHKVWGADATGWNANKDAVATLLQALGYPTTPPTPIASLKLDSCRFHVLP